MQAYDLIIIGGGPAGISAGIYAARYKLKTLIIAKELGGYLNEIHLIENYPGFSRISGQELLKKFKYHLENYKVEVKQDEVIGIRKNKKFIVSTEKEKFEGKKIILALGSEKRKLNLKDEEKFVGKGISYCYTCDAPLSKNKIIAIVGGADSAVRAASLLTEYAKKVYIFYRKDKLRGNPIEVEKVLKKIEFLNNVNVKELKGKDFLESVILDNGKKIKLDGLFVEIGSVPNVAIAKELGVKLDKDSYIITNEKKETNVKGGFAVGDVTNNKLKQIVVACSDGAKAATNIFHELKGGIKNG